MEAGGERDHMGPFLLRLGREMSSCAPQLELLEAQPLSHGKRTWFRVGILEALLWTLPLRGINTIAEDSLQKAGVLLFFRRPPEHSRLAAAGSVP